MTESVTQRVIDALSIRLPFDETDPFQPKSLIGKVFYGKRSWHAKHVRITPVAFTPNIRMSECCGVVSSHGGMSPYIWIDAEDHLIMRDSDGNFHPVDPSLLGEKELEDLEIGVMGDSVLLNALFEEAWNKACNELTSRDP